MTTGTTASAECDLQHAAKPWRMVVVVSGLLLAATFVMPFAETPWERTRARWLAVLIANTQARDPLNRLVNVCSCLNLHLLGLLAASAAAARIGGRHGWARGCGWALAVVLALWGTAWIIFVLSYMLQQHMAMWTVANAVGFLAAGLVPPLVLLCYLAFAARLGDLAFLCFTFPPAVFYSLGLLFENAVGHGSVGLWSARLGSIGLLFATVGEAVVLTDPPLDRVLWRLVTCRLQPKPTHSEICPACGYCLFGLTEQRCPECARPFTFEELGITPEKLGFGNGDESATGGRQPGGHMSEKFSS
ncbi:MAG: hypothetical protein JXA69_15795 [Phycisphaerae bacterium]|nr:hypothetical protein [Phycisphaerae bacterium]